MYTPLRPVLSTVKPLFGLGAYYCASLKFSVFIATDKWRELLQDRDSGIPLSTEDVAAQKESPKKKFKQRILHAGHTYESIFKLATIVYMTYLLDERGGKWFPNLLPKNKSDNVHRIGSCWIRSCRIECQLVVLICTLTIQRN